MRQIYPARCVQGVPELLALGLRPAQVVDERSDVERDRSKKGQDGARQVPSEHHGGHHGRLGAL